MTIMKALYAVHDKANRAEVIKILKEHGATLEGGALAIKGPIDY
jgi:hypothetical protein